MKKILFALAVVAVVTLAACKGGASTSTPEGALKGFMEHMQKMDIDGAKKYATKESAAILDMAKAFIGMGKEFAKNMDADKLADNEMEKLKKAKIEYGTPKIDGDNATIAVTTKVEGKEPDTKDVKLKKEDGAWKVAFDKSSLMGSDNKGEMPDMKDLNEAKDVLDSLGNKIDPEKLKEKMEEVKKMLDSLKK